MALAVYVMDLFITSIFISCFDAVLEWLWSAWKGSRHPKLQRCLIPPTPPPFEEHIHFYKGKVSLIIWIVFYKPCLLRIQRRQQEEEAEAERWAEEEEVNQREFLKRTPPTVSYLYNDGNIFFFEHTFVNTFWLCTLCEGVSCFKLY